MGTGLNKENLKLSLVDIFKKVRSEEDEPFKTSELTLIDTRADELATAIHDYVKEIMVTTSVVCPASGATTTGTGQIS